MEAPQQEEVSQSTTMNAQCRKCDTDIAQLISETAHRTTIDPSSSSSSCCDTSQPSSSKAIYSTSTIIIIQQVQFDGSKESLELSLANVLADRRLRDYGLGHIVPFILKNIPDLYECEDLSHVAVVSLVHEEVTLLRIVNQRTGLTKALELDVGTILQSMERTETSHAQTSPPLSPPPPPPHTAAAVYPQPYSSSSESLRRLHPLLLSSVVGALVGVLTYWKLNYT